MRPQKLRQSTGHAGHPQRPAAGWQAVLLASGILLGTAQPAQAMEAGELRASYVLNLSKFVDWPPTALGPDAARFQVCVQGDEILNTLTAAFQGKAIGARPIVASPLSRHPRGEGCQVLFITKSELWRMDYILAEIGSRPILTISDGTPFARTGGMVELIPQDGRLVFEISLAAVERAGLKISSKVLALAKAVYK